MVLITRLTLKRRVETLSLQIKFKQFNSHFLKVNHIIIKMNNIKINPMLDKNLVIKNFIKSLHHRSLLKNLKERKEYSR